MRILIVDDEAGTRNLIAEVVQEMGHEVALAANGPDGLRLARGQPPDLILLDVTMPGMNGFEVCEVLRAEPRTSEIPVIMLTGMQEPEHRVRGLITGADDYVTKPFSPGELAARIEKRLKAKSAVDALREQQAKIRRLFERLVEPPVVEKLLQNPELVKLGGELQEVSVLFADLEGFSAMAERIPPGSLLGALNQYHELMVSVARRNHGTVNKFLGDGVMVLYNTPLSLGRHALAAVSTALEIRDALGALHARLEPGHRLGINIGVHTGQAVVGGVGAAELMEFTAVGDTVNLAARLQETASRSQILASAATFEQVSDRVVGRAVGELRVKNRAVPVMTYEVLGWR